MAFPIDEQIMFVILCHADDAPLTLPGLLVLMTVDFPGTTISAGRITRLLNQLCEKDFLTRVDKQYFKGINWLKFMNHASEVMIGNDREMEAVIAFSKF